MLMFFGHKHLAHANSVDCLPRYKLRQKAHVMLHITAQAVAGRRNPRSWWSFKEEETMGRLSKIAVGTHAVSVCNLVVVRYLVVMQ